MQITATQVKELREATGVGMMECKKALTENQGDMDKAIVWLRERGLARAATKASRTAAEGLVEIAVSADHKSAAIVEFNCETDFSAKNDDFTNFSRKLAQLALAVRAEDVEQLKQASMDGQTVADALAHLIAKVGENMNIRRVQFIHMANGFVSSYNHMAGRIGVLVSMEGTVSEASLELGRDLAMHVAASAPKYFDRTFVSQAELDQEKEIARKKLLEQGKPEAMVEKILQGQVSKFYTEICFVDQPFVKEPKLSVAEHAKQAATGAKPVSFARFQLGEGIVVEKQNFADEVAAQLKA